MIFWIERGRRTVVSVAILGSLTWLAGCQPSVEERLERAEGYLASDEYRSADIELRNLLGQQPEHARAHALQAEASYQLGDLAAAQAGYERALQLGLDEPGLWIGLGRALVDAGRAEEAFERVVPHLPEQSTGVAQSVLIGDTLLQLGNADEAETHFETALSFDPEATDALVGLAGVAMLRGNATVSEERVEQALVADPDSLNAWAARASIDLRRGDLDAAVVALGNGINAAGEGTPRHRLFQVLSQRVSVLLDAQRIDKAANGLAVLEAEFRGYPLVDFLAGRIAFAREDFEPALGRLQSYVSRVPDDLRGTLMLGAVTLAQGKLRQAEMYLSQAVRANVGGERARRMLAEAQMRMNRPDQALQGLRQSEAAGQDDPMLLSMLGRAELGAGNADAALRYFEASAAAEGRSPAVDLSIAAGFLAAGEHESAVELLQAMPDNGDTRYRRESLLIAAHLNQGDRDQAVAVAQQLVTENADDPVAHALAGALQQSLGDLPAARSHFEKALDLDPDNAAALFALSRQARSDGDLPEARRLLEQLLASQPAFTPALADLNEILRQQDDMPAMQSYLDAAIDAAPESPAPRLMQIRNALREGRSDQAMQLARNAENLFPDDPSIMHASGLALMQAGQTEAALANLSRAARETPGNAQFQFDFAAASYRANDAASAVWAITKYRELQPRDLQGLTLQVRAELARGAVDRARQAVASYRATHGSEATMPALAFLEGDIEQAAGNPSIAAGHYETVAEHEWSRPVAMRLAAAYQAAGSAKATDPLLRWLEENPSDDQVRLMYAQVLQSQGDRDTSTAVYEQLIESDSVSAIALNNLAWEYAEKGREGAEALARRALELQPDNGSIMDTLGWILYRNGKLDEALPLLRQAAERSPDNPEIRFHLATVLAESGSTSEARTIIAELVSSDRQFPSRRRAEEMARNF